MLLFTLLYTYLINCYLCHNTHYNHRKLRTLSPNNTIDKIPLGKLPRTVVYWGQNSYGASHPNAPTEWEKSLGEYCDDVSIDMIIISFLYNFNIHNDQALPELNLSYHCNTTFVEHPSLLKCPNIEKDIIYCQSKNKRILLSLGGASGTYGFTNLNQISTFTKTIWDSYLGGNGKYRPFGSAILDGIDLDIEGGSDLGYAELVHSFREYYVRSTNKRYIIAAAPQCVFPDAFLGKAFMQAHFDYIFIQFYNNYCGVNNMNQFNYDQWHQWAIKNSINPNVKLYLGVPGSVNAANQGYLNPVSLIEILDKLKKYTSFAGVMIWDASQSDKKIGNELSFINVIANHLKNKIFLNDKYDNNNNNTYNNNVITLNEMATETQYKNQALSHYFILEDLVSKIELENNCISDTLACTDTGYLICRTGNWILQECPEDMKCSPKYLKLGYFCHPK